MIFGFPIINMNLLLRKVAQRNAKLHKVLKNSFENDMCVKRVYKLRHEFH